MNQYFCEVKGKSKGLVGAYDLYFQLIRAANYKEAYEKIQKDYYEISEWRIKDTQTNKVWTHDKMTTMDGFEDCVDGIVERFGQPPIVCYDKEKVLCRLADDGLSPEECLEYFEFNQLGSWVGETTPCFITHTNNEQI